MCFTCIVIHLTAIARMWTKDEHNNDCLRAALRVGGRRGGMWQRTLNSFFKGR